MKTNKPVEIKDKERGAALVMVLIISTLLLIVGGAVLLSASMNTANVSDSLAEEQAYYAAESGIQTALNVLRGNLPSASPSPTPKITYRQAVSTVTSNAANDNSTQARLSRYITYSSYVNGGANQVNIGGRNDLGFRLSVENPITSSNTIVYRTAGAMNNGASNIYQIGSIRITYNSKSDTTVDVSSGSANIDVGSFTFQTGSATTWNNDIRFSITVRMTAPNVGSRMIRGWIKKTTSNSQVTKVGDLALVFDTTLWELTGSRFSLSSQTFAPTPATASTSTTTITASLTPPELQRIIIRSTGFGPRGAQKQLEAFIRKDLMSGLYAPATITLVGTKDNMVFNEGNSNVTTYSGDDAASNLMIPPIGTAIPGLDINAFANTINKVNVTGEPGDVTDELPDWMQSAQNLDTTIKSLKLIAQSSGRYFPAGVTPSNFGSTTGKGITFADGNVSLSGNGGGILICTGTLTLDGDFDFKGMIIVTGAGGVQRNGGGGGKLLGNMVIAPYNPSNLAAGFSSPKYDLNGGGNSTIQFDSSSVFNGLEAIDNVVVALAEK